MKRLATFLLRILLLICVIFFAVWVFLVYPDDRRISPFESRNRRTDSIEEGAANAWVVKSRLFGDGMTFRFDMSEADYDRSFKVIESSLPVEAQVQSVRFHSSQQRYLPVGLYPYRLDGRDGIFLPAGHSLFVSPSLVGRAKMQVGLWSPGSSAVLEVRGGSSSPSYDIEYGAPKPGVSMDSLWYKAVGKWLHVDMAAGRDFPGWVDGSAVFELSKSDEVRLTCRAGGADCLISEPVFLMKEESPRKNFIVILVDTLRRDAINPDISPHMYRFSQNSFNFSRAISPGNMTSPSTNALLSCRLPSELGSWAFAYGVSKDERNEIYRKPLKSFPETFSKAGFLTAMIGSVSVISELYGVGIHHGFDRQIAIETDGVDTAQITREAQVWLAEHASQRFFLYVHLNAPHAPYKAPWRDVFFTWPGFDVFRSYANILRWLYAGEVHYTDRYVDVLLRTLDDLGLGNNTIVTLVADHGDQMTTHKFEENEAGPNFEGSYFDHGATLLDDEVGVPLVIHDPEAGVGANIQDRVSTIDLGPTLMDMAGFGKSVSCAGKSLMPYLAAKKDQNLANRVLATEGFQGRAIIFENRFKYIRSYEPTQKKIHHANAYFSEPTLYFSKEQLYDLEADPAEERNLATVDKNLLSRARSSYRQTFGIKEGVELVIESPDGAEIEGEFGSKTKLQVDYGQAVVSEDRGRVHLRASGQTTLVLKVENWDPKASWLRIGDHPVSIGMTSLRLPAHMDTMGLPLESGGHETLIPYPKEASAYIRRVEDSGREERKIRITNPAFESVLREWGYLNDR